MKLVDLLEDDFDDMVKKSPTSVLPLLNNMLKKMELYPAYKFVAIRKTKNRVKVPDNKPDGHPDDTGDLVLRVPEHDADEALKLIDADYNTTHPIVELAREVGRNMTAVAKTLQDAAHSLGWEDHWNYWRPDPIKPNTQILFSYKEKDV